MALRKLLFVISLLLLTCFSCSQDNQRQDCSSKLDSLKLEHTNQLDSLFEVIKDLKLREDSHTEQIDGLRDSIQALSKQIKKSSNAVIQNGKPEFIRIQKK